MSEQEKTSPKPSTAPAPKLSKKQQRQRAQRKQLMTMGAIVALVVVVIGGVLLQYQGAASLPWSLLALLIPTGVVIAMSRHGFRQGRGAA